MARNFVRASATRIRFTPGALTLTDAGNRTFVGICKRASVGGQHSIVGLNYSTDVSAMMQWQDTTNKLKFSVNGANVFQVSTFTVPVASNWVLVAAGKTSGTTTPRFHLYVYDTNTWTHEDAAGTMIDGSGQTTTTVEIGSIFNGFDSFDGDIALAGIFPSVLTDAQVETLPFSLMAWLSLSPAGLWLLDQSDTAQNVIDMTGGGANQTAITGTSVSTNSVPIFSYGYPVLRAERPVVAGAPVLDAAGLASSSGTAGLTAKWAADSAGLASSSGTAAITVAPVSSDAILNPWSDVSVNSWTTDTGGTTSLYAAIDETTASDTDYVQSPANADSSSYYETAVEARVDPVSSSGHIVHYRYRKLNAADTVDLTVSLRQSDATEIASWVHSGIGTTWTTQDQTLTSGQADSITNYADLRLRFVPTVTGGAPSKVADRGSVADTASSTTTAVSMSAGGSITVGNYLIARVAADNSGGGGAARTVTISDPRGNSWTVLTQANRDPGAANEGTTCTIAYAKVANAYSNGDSITVTYSGAVVADSVVIEEWTGIHATVPEAQGATTATGGSATPSIARDPQAASNVVYCALAIEGPGSDSYTEDSDTTSGTWATLTVIGGSNATADLNQKTAGAYKAVSAGGSQTWDPTITSRDWAAVAFAIAKAVSTNRAQVSWANFELPGGVVTHVLAAAGLASSSGIAAVGDLIPVASAGLASSSGTAALGTLLPVASVGLASSSGTAAVGDLIPIASAGLASSSGTGAANLTMPLASAGLASSSGSADLLTGVVLASAGLASSSGTAGLLVGVVLEGTGLASSSGTGAVLVGSVLTATGMGSSSGAVAANLLFPLAASGLASSSGAAVARLVGGAPALIAHLTTDISDANATSYDTASFTSTVDRPLFVGVLVADTAAVLTPTLSKTGVSLSSLGGIEFDTAGTRRGIFLFVGIPTSTSTGVLTITPTEAVVGCGWTIFEATNHDPTDLIEGSAITASGNGTAIAATLPAFVSTNNVAVAVMAVDVDGTFTAGQNFTIIGQDVSASAAPVQSIASERATNDETVDATGPAGLWGTVAAEVRASTGAVVQPLAADGLASSAGTAALRLEMPLAETGLASSSGSALLGALPPLEATGLAASGGAATLQVAYEVVAVGVASSLGTGAIVQTLSLASAALASSSGSADLLVSATLTATGFASSAGAGTLTTAITLEVTGVASSSGQADAGLRTPLATAGLAASDGSATIGVLLPLAASGVAASSGTADVMVGVVLIATGLAASTGTADVTAPIRTEATGLASSSGAASVLVEVRLVSDGMAASSGLGALELAVPLAGTGLASSSGIAGLALGLPVAATGLAASDGSAAVLTAVTLAGSGVAASAGAGSLAATSALVSSGLASSDGSAALVMSADLSAAGVASSSGVADALLSIGLVASASAASSGTASADLIAGLTGAVVASSSGAGDLHVVSGLASSGLAAGAGAAGLIATWTFAAAGLASSSGVAGLEVPGDLEGLGLATSSGSAPLIVAVDMRAAGAASSSGAASLAVIAPLSSIGVASSSGAATLVAGVTVAAAALASSAGTGAVVVTATLAATGVASSSGVAGLATTAVLAASGLAFSAGAGALDARAVLEAAASASSSGSAIAAVSAALTGVGLASSSGMASTAVRAELVAGALASSSGSAAMEIPGAGAIEAVGLASSAGSAELTLVALPLEAAALASSAGAASLAIPAVLGAQGLAAAAGEADLVVSEPLQAPVLVSSSGSAALILEIRLGGVGAATSTSSATATLTLALMGSGLASTLGAARFARPYVGHPTKSSGPSGQSSVSDGTGRTSVMGNPGGN
jgi:hypothetical protein